MLVGAAAIVGLLLWTHYWSAYLLAATGVVLLWWGRRRGTAERGVAVRLLLAGAAGAVAFLPWVPTMLDQAAHTGTPWAVPARPAIVLDQTLEAFGGGDFAEARVLGLVLALLFLVGSLGSDRDPDPDPDSAAKGAVLRLGRPPRGAVSGEATTVILTFALGTIAGYVGGTAYAPRYAAVLFPLVAVVVGRGVAVLPGAIAPVVAVVTVALLGVAGIGANIVDDRTQAGEIAAAISREAGPDDVVAVCPDQLGPAVRRALDDEGLASIPVLAYPTLDDGRFVDWVDYETRNDATDPGGVAADALDRADPSGSVWVVWNGAYKTFEGDCEAFLNGLAAERGALRSVVAAGRRLLRARLPRGLRAGVKKPATTRPLSGIRADLLAALPGWVAGRVLVGVSWLVALVLVEVRLDGVRPVPMTMGLFGWDGAYYRDLASIGYVTRRVDPVPPARADRRLERLRGAPRRQPQRPARRRVGASTRARTTGRRRPGAAGRRPSWASRRRRSPSCGGTPKVRSSSSPPPSCSRSAGAAGGGPPSGARWRRWRGRAVRCSSCLPSSRPSPGSEPSGRHESPSAGCGDGRRRSSRPSPPLPRTSCGWGRPSATAGSRCGSSPTCGVGSVFLPFRIVEGFGEVVFDPFGDGAHLPFALGMLALVWVAWTKLPASWAALATASVLVNLSAGNWNSIERYAFGTVPLIVAFAAVTGGRRWRWSVVLSGATLVGMSAMAWYGRFVP